MGSVNLARTIFKWSHKFINKNFIARDFRLSSQLNNIINTYNELNILKNDYDERNQKSRSNSNTYFLLGGNLFTFFGLLKSDEEKEKEPEYIIAMKRSILLIQREEYEKAEQMLHIALRQAQTVQHFQAITYIYDLMANLAFDVGDFDKAETLFVNVMQRLISTGTAQDDLQIVHMSLKLAKIFESRGDFQKAEDGYKFCMQAVKNNSENEETTFFWLMTLDGYAQMLVKQSRETEAYKFLLEAYDLSKQINGLNHEHTITILNDLGTISCRQGQYDLSIKFLNEAIEAGKELEEVDLSVMHINLGYVYMKKGLIEEAKKSCNTGKILSKLQSNEESLEEANTCLNEIKKLSELK